MASSFDMTRLRKAVRQLGPLARKGNKELMQAAAKGFVKDVIAVTPPASAKASGNAAKKAGEATIQADILKIAQPVLAVGRGANLATESDIIAAHDRARSNAQGRVNPRGRKEKIFAAQAVVLRVIAKLQKQVGFLAAGLVKAAKKLGVKIPAWIARHGNAPGAIREHENSRGYRLEVENAVGFIGDVKGYERRWQRVLDYQAAKMERQADYLLKEIVKKGGF